MSTVTDDLYIPPDTLAGEDANLLAMLEGSGMDNDFAASSPSSRIYPGVYSFRFEITPVLDKQTKEPLAGGLGSTTIQNEIYKQLQFTAYIDPTSVPADHFIKRLGDAEIEARYQKVSNFKTKRGLSGWAELYRCLGLVQKFGTSPNDAFTLKQLRLASKTAVGRAEFKWRGFDKDASVSYSTHPGKKETPWTMTEQKFANGGFVPVDRIMLPDQDNPGQMRALFPNLEIINFLTPVVKSA